MNAKKEHSTMKTLQPPVAKRIPLSISMHGDLRDDPYKWMKAKNWQEALQKPSLLPKEITDYLEAENAYCDAMMKDTEVLQKKLVAEMRGRIKEEDESVPEPDGEYAYYSRTVEGGEYGIYCRKDRALQGPEEILFDGNKEAERHEHFALGDVAHSPNHKLTAYAVDTNGSEHFTLRIRDIETGKEFEDLIEDTRGDFEWGNDSKTLFYVRLDNEHRPRWVYKHVLGTSEESDVLLYEENDPGFFVALGKTDSRRFLLVSAHDHTTSEVYYLDLADPKAVLTIIAPRENGVEYDVSHHGETFFILTNDGGAEDFKIVCAPVGSPEKPQWSDLISHRQGIFLVSCAVLENHLIRLERENALPRIVIRRLSDGEEHEISFDEEAYALGVSMGYEFATTKIRFTYSSLTTPAEQYEYDMDTRGRRLLKKQEVPSGHDPKNYVTQRIYAEGLDGVNIPVTLLRHKDTPIDSSAPVWLFGYGAYGITYPPSFNATCLNLVNRGYIYALAHIRGGTDCGYRWYLDSRQSKKKNTYEDFISVAEHLIHEGYTSPRKIAIYSGSAGGTLIGYCINERPELFGAAIASVPFVDVVNTMCDTGLPLTPAEWPEWGNPIESEEAYHYIKSYSPYDNVREQEYPPLLVTAGISDPRVTYWEPAKWVAKLRTCNEGKNPILFKTEMEHGHSGATGRFKGLEEVALFQAFVLKMLGMTK
jgi:oligopeptidase B